MSPEEETHLRSAFGEALFDRLCAGGVKEFTLDTSPEARAKRIADLNGAVPDWARDNPRLNPKVLCAIEKQTADAKAFLQNKAHFSVTGFPIPYSHKMPLPGILFNRGNSAGVTFCHPLGLELAEQVAKHLDAKYSKQDQAPVYVWNQRVGGMAYVFAYWNVMQRPGGEQRQVCIQFAPGNVSDFSALADLFADPTLKDFACTVRVIDHVDAFEFIHCVELKRGDYSSAPRWVSVF